MLSRSSQNMLQFRRLLSSQPAAISLSKPVVALLEAQNGVAGLFSKATTDDCWTKRVESYTGDLEYAIEESKNAQLGEVVGEKVSPLEQYHKLMKLTGTDKDEKLAFNSASALYNLNMFFSSLKPNVHNTIAVQERNSLLDTPNYQNLLLHSPNDSVLMEHIIKCFGSYEEFVTNFMASANAVQGNGYTWLVMRTVDSQPGANAFRGNASLALVNTYNNGTPTTLTKGQVSAVGEYINKEDKVFNARAKSEIPTLEEAQTIENFDYTCVPLFGVPSNPSFFLRDYGVFGKEQYLQNAFKCLDWDVISARFKAVMTTEKK